MPEFNDVDYRLYNATLDWDLGFATLTSATSYNEFESPFRADVTLLLSAAIEPFFGPNEGVQEQTTKYDKVTQELRLASHVERFVRVAGRRLLHEGEGRHHSAFRRGDSRNAR